MTFEEFLGNDGTPIGTYYPDIRFEAMSTGEDWIVSDVTTGSYNVSSWPSGQQWMDGMYWMYDYVAAWTGILGDSGKIIFDRPDVTSVEIGYSCSGQLSLTAYDSDDNQIDSDSGPANLRYMNGNESGPGTLGVDASGGKCISYVIIHDTGNGWVVDNISVCTGLELTKTDDVDDGDCISPSDALVYTICWENIADYTYSDVYIIDYLPAGVCYPVEYTIDPNFTIISSDPNYNEEDHTYIWDIGTIPAHGSGCVELTVYVNEMAEPGMTLHNAAEMFAGDDRIGRATEDTPVCCWAAGSVIYVDKDATGVNSGTSWTNAYTDLQKALARARTSTCADVNTIYTAYGTYIPGSGIDDSFEIPDGVSVYGGFAGWETSPDQRDIKSHPTILTGYIDPNNRSDTVVQMGDGTVLDGVIVQDAAFLGQGILCEDADSAIINCTIRDNISYGLFADDSDVVLKWCRIENNGYDGIRHIGNGKGIIVENCQINDNHRYGLYLKDSVFTVMNSVVCNNGIDNSANYFGIWIENPKVESAVHNNTIAYNYKEAIAYIDDDPNYINAPDVQNCIIWYNNGGGEQFAGVEFATHYSCIQDPNDPNGLSTGFYGDHNFSHKPDFAYGGSSDPNATSNIHLAYTSFCKDKGNPSLSYTGQLDIDKEDRVADTFVDVGADEVNCEDVYTERDWNADGIVNLDEFNYFSKAWLSRDPNDPSLPTDPNDPGYITDPNVFAHWNPRCDLNGDYNVGLPDLIMFVDDTPWLWTACWKQQELLEQQMQQQMMMSMPPQIESFTGESLATETDMSAEAETEAVVSAPEKSIAEQIADLQDTIDMLETIWDENPELQQEIQPEQWQEFMDDVYNSLTELEQSDTITQ